MLRKSWVRMLLWTSLAGLLAAIFLFSAQPKAESDELTEVVAMPLAELIASWRTGPDGYTVQQLYHIVGTIARKLAHFLEYAFLGLLLRLLAMSYGWNEYRLPVIAGVLYAVSDEIHQLFVPGRTGLITDVLIDAAGVCCGVALITWMKHIRRNKNVHDSGSL